MTEQLIVGAIALLLAAWIIRPLLERRRGLAPPPDDPRTADLLEAKQSVYRSIVDLEMDHEMGKMDRDDYLQLRQQSKAEALHILQELEGDNSKHSEELTDQTLEDEIRAARARMRRK